MVTASSNPNVIKQRCFTLRANNQFPLQYNDRKYRWKITTYRIDKKIAILLTKVCFIRRISVASNAIQTMDNEVNHLIIYCLNCIRRD